MPSKILVEPGSYACLNMGDVAMMQVAVTRLRDMWPKAEIGVVTGHTDRLARFCPAVTPISMEARNAWLSGRYLIGGLRQKLPNGISATLQNLESHLWLQHPKLSNLGVRLKANILRRPAPSPSSFRKKLAESSLLVVSGTGRLNDAFADSACPLLDELEFALHAGIPVIAFGQGVGPITDPELLKKARTVLPRLKLIGLREGRMGLPLLESLGVPRNNIYITGDDAIELAFQSRPSFLGNAIGINLRLAGYAGTGSEMVVAMREPLQHAVQTLNSFLVPIPISLHSADSDVDSIGRIMSTQNNSALATVECPEDVTRRIGDCRVVVTGSYHGGVFALAQGIPVVGLVNSPYYEQKFLGLQEQFPGGCRILDFRRSITAIEIQNAIQQAWESAAQVRESLLRAAAHQIDCGHAAYKKVRELFPTESWQ